jgi:hypothetical protein
LGVIDAAGEGLAVGEGVAEAKMVAVALGVDVGVGVTVGWSVGLVADAQLTSTSAAVSAARIFTSAETVSVSRGFRSEF